MNGERRNPRTFAHCCDRRSLQGRHPRRGQRARSHHPPGRSALLDPWPGQNLDYDVMKINLLVLRPSFDDAGEAVQDISGVRGREAGLRGPKRARIAGREPDPLRQGREIASGGLLADAPRGLTLHPQRDRPRGKPRPGCCVRLDLVPAVHLRVDEADRAHQPVHEGGSARRRAAEGALEGVRGRVVGELEHPAQELIERRAVRGGEIGLGQGGHGDRKLQGRGGRERCPRVPGRSRPRHQVLDGDGGRGPEALRQPPDVAPKQGVEPRSRTPRGGRERQPENASHPRRAPTAPAVERDYCHRRLALGQGDPQAEAAVCQRPARQHRTARANDHAPRAGGGDARDDAERDLVRRGLLDGGRRRGQRGDQRSRPVSSSGTREA